MEEKGLSAESADQIGHYVKLHGGRELIKILREDPKLMAQPDFKAGLEDLGTLMNYCIIMNTADKVTMATTIVSLHSVAIV